jgi:alpha-D-ribose 1-methylphosphonate 5-triphosphate synthase subunit PhnL
MTQAPSASFTPPVLALHSVAKRFTLHNQHGTVLPVFDCVNLEVRPGECVVLDGPSGMGKSTLLKLVYANYRPSEGMIWVQTAEGTRIDVAQATPRELVALRRHTIGYVSQFLRVIPRVSALDVVAEPLIEDIAGDSGALASAREQAREWLLRLRIPERLWSLPPATFSGGEQQRINIARNLIKPRPLLLLDEPTASLDAANTQTVIDLIYEARARGAALLGIFHDRAVAEAVGTRFVRVASFRLGEPPVATDTAQQSSGVSA